MFLGSALQPTAPISAPKLYPLYFWHAKYISRTVPGKIKIACSTSNGEGAELHPGASRFQPLAMQNIFCRIKHKT